MKFSANVHVLNITSGENDVMLSHLFKKGETITKEVYLRILRTKPRVNRGWKLSPGSHISFSRTVYKSFSKLLEGQNSLDKTYPHCRRDSFGFKEFWPLNSSDLNPLGYYVWSVIKRVTNKSTHLNVASRPLLRQHLWI